MFQTKVWTVSNNSFWIFRYYITQLIESVDIFDYCNYNDIDKLLDNKYIEVVKGEIESSQLQIDEYLYTYVKELDIFMCLNLEKYEEFVKVQAIYDKCKKM